MWVVRNAPSHQEIEEQAAEVMRLVFALELGLELELDVAASSLVVGGWGAHSSLGGGKISRFALRCCQALLSL
jgi:hypothetical protein